MHGLGQNGWLPGDSGELLKRRDEWPGRLGSAGKDPTVLRPHLGPDHAPALLVCATADGGAKLRVSQQVDEGPGERVGGS
jgi:hypothetical protein